MKSSRLLLSNKRGSMLITVILFSFVLSVYTVPYMGSLLSEKRQIQASFNSLKTFALAEASVEAMYIAIQRAAITLDSQVSSLVGAQWVNDNQSTITHGGSYVIIKASIGIRLIDTNQTPLLTPTSIATTAKFDGEDVC